MPPHLPSPVHIQREGLQEGLPEGLPDAQACAAACLPAQHAGERAAAAVSGFWVPTHQRSGLGINCNTSGITIG